MIRFNRARGWAAVAILAVVPTGYSTTAPVGSEAEISGGAEVASDHQCQRSFGKVRIHDANGLVKGTLQIRPWKQVKVGRLPRWDADPYGSPTWVTRLHSLQWLDSLKEAFLETGRASYIKRWRTLFDHWIDRNPLSDPPSWASWEPRMVAVRAQMLACAMDWLPQAGKYREALRVHGRRLADSSQFVHHGNHALDQAIGLLAAGCKLDHERWKALSVERISTLVRQSIDDQGGLNEGAISYALLNQRWYSEAIARMRACGIRPPPIIKSRVRLLQMLVVHGTTPDGAFVPLGDGSRRALSAGFAPEGDYLLTRAGKGRAAKFLHRWYRVGWMFDRSSWTDPDASHLALRTNRIWLHGHPDVGSFVLSAYGRRLLDEGGFYGYSHPYNLKYFYRPWAHNIVQVDGATIGSQTADVARSGGDGYRTYRMRIRLWHGVVWYRTVVSIGGGKTVIVADYLEADRPRVFRTLWHFPHGSSPKIGEQRARTQFSRGNLTIATGGDSADLRIVKGRMSPMQGWTATGVTRMVAAPVLEVIRSQRVVRSVTILATAAGAAPVKILSTQISRDGFSVTAKVKGERLKLEVDGVQTQFSRTPLR